MCSHAKCKTCGVREDGVGEECIRFWKVTKVRKYTARPEFLQGCPERLFYEAVEAKLKWKDVRDPEDSCRHRVEPVGNKTGKVTQVLKPSESSDSFMRPRCQTWSYRIFGVCHPGLQKSCLTLSLLAVPPVLHFEREVFTLRQCLLEVCYLSLNFTGIKSLS